MTGVQTKSSISPAKREEMAACYARIDELEAAMRKIVALEGRLEERWAHKDGWILTNTSDALFPLAIFIALKALDGEAA